MPLPQTTPMRTATIITCAMLLLSGCTTDSSADAGHAGIPVQEQVAYDFLTSDNWTGQLSYETHIADGRIAGNVSARSTAPDDLSISSTASFVADWADGRLLQIQDQSGLTTAFPEGNNAYFPNGVSVVTGGLVIDRQSMADAAILNLWTSGLMRAGKVPDDPSTNITVDIDATDGARQVTIGWPCQSGCHTPAGPMIMHEIRGTWTADSLFPLTMTWSSDNGLWMRWMRTEHNASSETIVHDGVASIPPLPVPDPNPCAPLPCDGSGWPEEWSLSRGISAYMDDPRGATFRSDHPGAAIQSVIVVQGSNGVPGALEYNDYTSWSIVARDDQDCGLFIVRDHSAGTPGRTPPVMEPGSPRPCEPSPTGPPNASPPYMSLAQSYEMAVGDRHDPEDLELLQLTVSGATNGPNPAFHAQYLFAFPDGALSDIYLVNAATGHLAMQIDDYQRRF